MLFLRVSDYTWLSAGVAGAMCVALDLVIRATRSWTIALLAAVNTGMLYLLGEMWLPSTFNVGIWCGVAWWFWVLVTGVLAVLAAARAAKSLGGSLLRGDRRHIQSGPCRPGSLDDE